jgi:hypothetical protein
MNISKELLPIDFTKTDDDFYDLGIEDVPHLWNTSLSPGGVLIPFNNLSNFIDIIQYEND